MSTDYMNTYRWLTRPENNWVANNLLWLVVAEHKKHWLNGTREFNASMFYNIIVYNMYAHLKQVTSIKFLIWNNLSNL